MIKQLGYLFFVCLLLFIQSSHTASDISIEQYLINKFPIELSANCEIKFEYHKFADDEILEDVKLISHKYDNYKLSIKFSKNGVTHSKILPVIRLKLCNYPVFNKKIDKNKIITYEDVIFTNQPYSNDPNIIHDPKILYDMTVRRPIIAGKIINILDIVKPLIVKKGQRLYVTYNRTNMIIKITAIALENGAKGDIIKAKNEKTDFVIYCEVGEDGNLILKN